MRHPTQSVIHTLWNTPDQQCELVFDGIHGCRLRLWIDGHLIVDEDVHDLATALSRSAELRVSFRALALTAAYCGKSRSSANADGRDHRDCGFRDDDRSSDRRQSDMPARR